MKDYRNAPNLLPDAFRNASCSAAEMVEALRRLEVAMRRAKKAKRRRKI